LKGGGYTEHISNNTSQFIAMKKTTSPDSRSLPFSQRILKWFDQHGRKDLPWQLNPTPYRVWVSEIMLQQTQVKTVIPYYMKFIARFPDVDNLANTSIDEVLHHWSGLGYYARARNLYKTAGVITQQFNGKFPETLDELVELPGIGRSTAAAILSLAYGQQQTILDGNVKRVLARHEAIVEWTGKTSTLKKLWRIAEDYTPANRTASYNQAMMDLGATLCTRTKPTCESCPVTEDCLALENQLVDSLPASKPKKKLPERNTIMLIIKKDTDLLLERRPSSGIWGGLWSFPEIDSLDELDQHCRQHWGLDVQSQDTVETWSHTFSHYRLNVKPYIVEVLSGSPLVMDTDRYIWYNSNHINKLGLAAPVKQILGKAPTIKESL
jgi:A/G-specific adenine glycosylase